MKPVVYNNVNVMMKAVIENAKPQGCSIQNGDLAQRFLSMSDEAEIDGPMGQMVTTLWNDPGFQATWDKRGNFQVQDSLSYYCKPSESRTFRYSCRYRIVTRIAGGPAGPRWGVVERRGTG